MEKWIDELLEIYFKTAADQIFAINMVLAMLLLVTGMIMVQKKILSKFFIGRILLIIGFAGLIVNILQRTIQG